MDSVAESFFQRPLWPDDIPSKLVKDWAEMKTWLSGRDEGWDIWFPIYEGFRDATPMDWDVLEKIALIPDGDWREDDPIYTNGIIAGIIAEFAERETSNGEVIEPDPETGLLKSVPLQSRNETYIETCVAGVEVAAKRLQTVDGSNEYSGIEDTLTILLEDIALDRGNAFSMFNVFSFAFSRVQKAVDDKLVPEPERDARLARLIDTLDKGIADLSGSEYVQEGLANRRAFADRGSPELVVGEVIEYAKASSMISEGVLKVELARDIEPRDANETAQEKAAREVRLYGRVLRIRRWLKDGNLEKAIALAKAGKDRVVSGFDVVKKLKGMVELVGWIMKLFS